MTGQYMDEYALVEFRRIRAALVDDILEYAFKRTYDVLAALGAKAADAEYYRAHAMAAIYAAADGLQGELCNERRKIYQRQDRRTPLEEVTPAAKATYR